MAFQGYLIKVGDSIIPSTLIDKASYKGAIHGQDLDSHINTNGVLIRKALKNVKPKCEFNTIDGISQTEFYKYIMKPIQNAYTDSIKKECRVSFWVAEINDYITHTCYVPDIEPTIDNHTGNEIFYEPIRIAFISNGGAV